jgi:hypothetical protein
MLGVAADSFNYGRRDDVIRNIVSTIVSISRGKKERGSEFERPER